MNGGQETTKTPWFKQPLVWLVIAFPAASVLGGLSMLVLSLNIDLGLVSDDYYRRGKAINLDLRKDRRARELGYHGVISYHPAAPAVAVALTMDPGLETDETPPAAVTVDIMHATRGGLDRSLIALKNAQGVYYAKMKSPLPDGPWRIRLAAQDWNLHGRLHLPRTTSAELAARL